MGASATYSLILWVSFGLVSAFSVLNTRLAQSQVTFRAMTIVTWVTRGSVWLRWERQRGFKEWLGSITGIDCATIKFPPCDTDLTSFAKRDNDVKCGIVRCFLDKNSWKAFTRESFSKPSVQRGMFPRVDLFYISILKRTQVLLRHIHLDTFTSKS